MKKNYFKNLAQVAMLLCVPLFIASCDEFGTEDNPIPSYISMKTDAVTIKKGETYTRTALSVSDAVIEYKSENEAIATVNPVTGEVTGVADGTTFIVAAPTGYSKGGKKIFKTDSDQAVKYELTVQDPESSFAYDFGEAGVPKQIYTGTNIKFEPVAPQKSSGVLTYTYQIEKSTDEGTTWLGPLGPDAEGKFTADGAGWYRITATSATYKPYVTSHANTTDSYIVKFDAGVTFARWNGTEFEEVTMLESKFDAIYTATIPTGTLTAGWYLIKKNTAAPYNTQFTGTLKLAGEGEINIVLEDGVSVWFPNGIFDEDDPANPHTLNFFKQVGANAAVVQSINATGDPFKNIGTINTYKVNISAWTSVDECGGFANIGAINIYDADVSCQSLGATNSYGAKMKNNGTITLYKGSFTANGKGTSEISKAVIGKLDMKAEGKKFVECATNSATASDWTAVPATGPTKLYVKTVAAE